MDKIRIITIAIFALACSNTLLVAQDSEPFFDQFKPCVALVEKIEKWEQGKKPKLAPLGTAFWVGSQTDGIVLVTNKHVLSNRDKIALRVYQAGGVPSAIMIVTLNDRLGVPLWVGHPDSRVDVAAIRINTDSIQTLTDASPRITTVQLSLFAKRSDVIEGDDIFFLGFPLGIRTTENSFPLLRAGIVSLKPIEDFLVLANGDTLGKQVFLLDAVSIGGSSGSPVFLKPGMTRPFLQPNVLGKVIESKLIGIISGHVIDTQTVYTPSGEGVALGNAGLAIVHPAEQILETIRLLKK